MSLPETHLTIIRPDGPTETRKYLPGAYVIGRSPQSDIFIETPLISRSHARLTIKDTGCVIEDLGSSNGTFVNGEKISAATLLRTEEKVMLGPVKIEFSSPAAAPAVAAPVSLEAKREALRKTLPADFLRDKRYEVGNTIAQGGMGAVLNARQLTIERNVAMKVMLDSTSQEDLLRFISEAKVTGQLEHPNIVPVHELGIDDKEQVFYTMKYVRGITLRKVLDLLLEAQPGTLEKYPLAQLLTVFQKVCDAVAFSHSKGVIHRDLKPENFMLGDYGEVLVMDWGLAKVLDPTRGDAANESGHSIIRTGLRKELHAAEVQSGNVMGTPQYMAPEQAYGQHEALDTRTDIYALGAILHHLLTLRPPIEGNDPQEVLRKAARGEFEPARKATAGNKRLPHLPGGKVPEALSAVAQKAMANRAGDRYQNIPDLQADIEAYQAGFATTAENPNALKHAMLLVKRQRLAFAGIAVILLMAAWIIVSLNLAQRRSHEALSRLGSDTEESAALLAKLRAAHPGSAWTKADYEQLAALAEKQKRPEAELYRDLANHAR
jgi:serine/threonine protein kinase